MQIIANVSFVSTEHTIVTLVPTEQEIYRLKFRHVNFVTTDFVVIYVNPRLTLTVNYAILARKKRIVIDI